MKTFTNTGHCSINLQNVSNINPLNDKNRIVYNFAYPVIIEYNGQDKMISDYQYDDFENTKEFEAELTNLKNNPYIQENFIPQNKGFVNINKISTFKVQEERLRVIFNMAHSIDIDTRYGRTRQPEFVYVNFGSMKELSEYTNMLYSTLVS